MVLEFGPVWSEVEWAGVGCGVMGRADRGKPGWVVRASVWYPCHGVVVTGRDSSPGERIRVTGLI